MQDQALLYVYLSAEISVVQATGYVIPPGGVVGNMLASHAVNPVQSRVGGIHSDLDDHYNGGPVSLDPQWHVKEP